MTEHKPDDHGKLIEPTTLTIQRLLPGPIERVWSYLTDSEQRRKWLASGAKDLTGRAPFELVWRNDELTDPPGRRPPSRGEEHRMQSRIIEAVPPRKLVFAWGTGGDVTFELEPTGDRVLLTVTHRRLDDPNERLAVATGWHSHLDVLVARLSGAEPMPFWDAWTRLREDYEKRLPG